MCDHTGWYSNWYMEYSVVIHSAWYMERRQISHIRIRSHETSLSESLLQTLPSNIIDSLSSLISVPCAHTAEYKHLESDQAALHSKVPAKAKLVTQARYTRHLANLGYKSHYLAVV